MVAVPVQRFDLFLHACRLLQRYRQYTPGLHGVGLEVALAIHSYRSHHPTHCPLPWVGQGDGLSIQAVAADICDPFYRKQHPQLPETLIWPIFNQGEDGLIRPLSPSHPGGKHAEWRWLKACNSQEGIGCHAIAPHLWQDDDFLASDRDLCPFRLYDGRFPFTVDQGRQTCGFDAHPCGWQSGFPKMLQIVGKGMEARVLQTPWTAKMWQMLVPPEQPIPLYPFLVAMGFGHATLGATASLTPEKLQQFLGLDDTLFAQLFDAQTHSPLNQELLASIDQDPPPTLGSPPFLLPHRAQPAGGKVILDPDEPPKFQGSGLPVGASRDPLMAERRRRRQLERTPHHNDLLSQFRRWFRLAGLEVREDAQYFDFLAVGGDRVLLAEVKLLYQRDSAEGIQELIGQLLYYEHFTLTPWREQGYRICKAAVFDQPPFGEYIDFLADLGIFSYWLTEDHHIDGREESLRLLRQMEVQVRPDPEFECG
ncbi:MAG: hypothetical protein OHK0012_17940 [Synechococcales cyanobacterium]